MRVCAKHIDQMNEEGKGCEVCLQARVKELEGLISDALSVATDSPELNMSNYNHDDVALLNTAMCEVHGILKSGSKQKEVRSE